MEALNKLKSRGPIRGLALDLRDNPGGLLDQAVLVANQFLDKGLIVYTRGRVKEQRVTFRATPSRTKNSFKLAVLINGGSASASEVLAGCLQDHARALLFGTRSFGKGSVQTIIPLGEGAALRLTTAYYFTPNGRNINDKGILPDVEIAAKAPDNGEESSLRSGRRGAGGRIADPKRDPTIKAALKWLRSNEGVQSARQAA
jgi:carboxyl-terminal processing protease